MSLLPMSTVGISCVMVHQQRNYCARGAGYLYKPSRKTLRSISRRLYRHQMLKCCLSMAKAAVEAQSGGTKQANGCRCDLTSLSKVQRGRLLFLLLIFRPSTHGLCRTPQSKVCSRKLINASKSLFSATNLASALRSDTIPATILVLNHRAVRWKTVNTAVCVVRLWRGWTAYTTTDR